MEESKITGFKGTIYTPQSEGYDKARTPWLRNYDSRPAIIVEPADTASVQAAVKYANTHDLSIAIQSTGHGAIKPTDGAMLIKTEQLKDIKIDPNAKTATVEPGVMMGDIVQAAAEYKLAPITGDSPYVGAMGFTLGGGHGWLSRQYGLAADSIVELQLITASGEMLHVNAAQKSDLFWGLKGGSGNFGIVVSLTIALHTVETGFAGSIFFDAKHARHLLEQYGTWAHTLPNQYSVFLQAVSLPPIPQLPETIRGRRVVALQFFINDADNDAAKVLRNFVEATGIEPLQDFSGKMTYAEFMATAPHIPPTQALDASGLQHEITADQITVLAHYMEGNASIAPIIQIRPWGGVLNQPDGHNLLQYSGVNYSVYATQSIAQGEDAAQVRAHFEELADNITSHSSRAFINFTADPLALQKAYGQASLQKLAALKAVHDPSNKFHFGHTVVVPAKN